MERDLSHPPVRSPDRAAHAADRAGAAFWRFSLTLYGRPGVADALIALQDRAGLDVNLILFGLWVGMRDGQELGRDGFAAAAEAAAELNGVVRGIRALRRQLGDGNAGDIRFLRGAVLRLELAVERRVQRRLAACAAPVAEPQVPGDPSSAALANLACCLGEEIEFGGGRDLAPRTSRIDAACLILSRLAPAANGAGVKAEQVEQRARESGRSSRQCSAAWHRRQAPAERSPRPSPTVRPSCAGARYAAGFPAPSARGGAAP